MAASPIRGRKELHTREPIKEFPEWTSTNGIPQIGRSKSRCWIIFWTVVTIICFALMIWQVAQVFVKYYRHEVSVQRELRFDQRTFPAVTLCSMNSYKQSEMANYPNATRLLDTYLYVMRKTACHLQISCFTLNTTLEGYQQMYGLVADDTTTLKTRAKRLLRLEMSQYDHADALVTIEDIIQSCSFNQEKCNMDVDWASYVDPLMGQCFTFNGETRRTANKAGPSYGLRLVARVNTSENLIVSDTAGVRLMIHDQEDWPFSDVTGYNAPTGRTTSIAVTYQEINRLSAPYGNCSNAKSEGFLYDRRYSIEGCRRSLYQQQIVRSCGCYDPAYPEPQGGAVRSCRIPENIKCWSQTLKRLNPGQMECIQPCNERRYHGAVSLAQWTPHDTMLRTCGSLSLEECRKKYQANGAVVEVYYKKLNYYAMHETIAYSSSNVLSDFGAQIGLWLGLSIITFVEFLVLGFQICTRCLGSGARKLSAF